MKYLLLLLIFLVGCGEPKIVQPPSSSLTSPNGIRIKSNSTVSSSTLTTMDASLAKLFQDAKLRNYTKKLNFTDYTIFIKEDCIDRNGTKVWLERNDSYNNTEFDQNPDPVIGTIFQAEQVILNDSSVVSFVICSDTEFNMSNATRYGAEHIILFYNDKKEYERTKIHTSTQGHPIIK